MPKANCATRRRRGAPAACRVAVVVLAGLTGPAAQAEEGSAGWVSELKAGVLLHDRRVLNNAFEFEPFTHNEEEGVDLHLALLFDSPDVLSWVGSPRPYLSTTISTAGGTNLWAAGLSWGYAFEVGLFVEGGLGLAIHDGETDVGQDSEVKEFGTRVVPLISAELGWRFGPRAQHGLSLYWEHMSHGGLFGELNDALDNWGLRYGYRF